MQISNGKYQIRAVFVKILFWKEIKSQKPNCRELENSSGTFLWLITC